MTTIKRKLHPEVVKRQAIEKRIARAVVAEAHRLGYTFKIDNGGEEDEHEHTSTVAKTLKGMFATDEDRLFIVSDGKEIGWVYFVYGNDGFDVIADYTTNLEEMLKPAQKVAERCEARA